MAEQKKASIDDMLQWDRDKLARGLASLQETQREAYVIIYSTPNEDPFDNRGRDWVDSVEYDFLRGLRKVPEVLLPYLRKKGGSREQLLDGASCLESNAGQIANEILETRGPLPAREKDPFGEHSFPGGTHTHYKCGNHLELDKMKKQLLDDTIQSLKDYAESILHIR